MRQLIVAFLLVACTPAAPPEATAAPVTPSATTASTVSAMPSASAVPVGDDRAAALAAEADSMQMQMLGAYAADGTTNAALVHPDGGRSQGLTPIPTGSARVANIVTKPDVPNAARVITSVSPRARACFQQGLKADPSLTGTVAISVTIGAAGEVAGTSVTPTKGSSVSAEVVACITHALKNLIFDPPDQSPAKLTATIALTAK